MLHPLSDPMLLGSLGGVHTKVLKVLKTVCSIHPLSCKRRWSYSYILCKERGKAIEVACRCGDEVWIQSVDTKCGCQGVEIRCGYLGM